MVFLLSYHYSHETSECRKNKHSSDNSKSNYSNFDSHSRIHQFQLNKSHNQPFTSPKSKNNNSSSNSSSLVKLV